MHCKSEGVGLPSVQTIDLPMAFMRLMDSRVYSSRLLFCSRVDSGGLERLVMERGMPYSVCFTPTSTVTKEIIQFAMECPSIHIPHTPTIPPHAKPNSPFSPSIIPFKPHSPCFPQQRDDLHALAFVLPSNSIPLLQSPTQRIPTSATCWPWVLRELPRLRY